MMRAASCGIDLYKIKRHSNRWREKSLVVDRYKISFEFALIKTQSYQNKTANSFFFIEKVGTANESNSVSIDLLKAGFVRIIYTFHKNHNTRFLFSFIKRTLVTRVNVWMCLFCEYDRCVYVLLCKWEWEKKERIQHKSYINKLNK